MKQLFAGLVFAFASLCAYGQTWVPYKPGTFERVPGVASQSTLARCDAAAKSITGAWRCDREFVATPPVVSTWTECAQENGTCVFTGTRNVRYGTSTAFFTRTFTATAACNNATFGDPASGQWKTCLVESVTTTAPVPPSSVVVQGSVTATTPMAQMTGGNIQLLGTYPALPTVPETGINGVGNVLGSPLRFGKVPDPTGANRQVFRYALSINDPDTAGPVKRVDTIPPGSTIQKDTIYWSAMEVYIPSNTFYANDDSTFSDVHVGANCCSGNWALQLNKGLFKISKTWNSGSGEQSQFFTPTQQPPADQWLKIIVQWKANATGANGAFLNVWINGAQVLADTGPNTVPGGGDYAKFGYYNWTISNGGDTSRPGREVFWRSYYLVKDAGYTLNQIVALLQ